MLINRHQEAPPVEGESATFTGHVQVGSYFEAPEPARVSSAMVEFQPGARTAWHTHPLGQTLLIVSGDGWIQCWGEQRQDMHPGDVIWIPPGVKHWHGATADSPMCHAAIQEQLNGSPVEWLEKVSDEQYTQ